MELEIKEIQKEEAWELRHIVMYPHKDLEYVKVKEDHEGIHYGLFQEETLISCISLFIKNEEAQFRKFATLQQEQGKGYGSLLLEYVMKEAEMCGVKKIWCNARVNKTLFYQIFGLHETNQYFRKGEIDYIIMEKSL
ncbi:GNAT family N-acetyltransferase [Evansella sp. AB-rgal1]|uniref:GNAT family N-acetyltransferase n=1 Tax=Evansella sp. AB-rgal1 TaxID=3242696 RepID=UPI00359E2DB8